MTDPMPTEPPTHLDIASDVVGQSVPAATVPTTVPVVEGPGEWDARGDNRRRDARATTVAMSGCAPEPPQVQPGSYTADALAESVAEQFAALFQQVHPPIVASKSDPAWMGVAKAPVVDGQANQG